MQQYALADVLAGIAQRLEADKTETVPPILLPALDQFPDQAALWYFAGVMHQRFGHAALASLCWEKSYQLDPQPQVLIGIGALLKDTGRPLEARAILQRCYEMSGGTDTLYTNLVGCYVNEGDPLPGIAYAELALKEGLANPQTLFNLGLLSLEAGQYQRGFTLYAEGEHKARDKRKYLDTPKLTAENFEQAKGQRLVIHGEQGIGDELMFGTMLNQISQDFQVIFDCHPRLLRLHESAPWADHVRLVPNRKDTTEWYQGEADFYTPIGNLARFYRSTPESFAWQGPYYFADPEEMDFNRKALQGLSPGKQLVGVAFRGGTLKTMRNYRMLPPSALDALFKRDDVTVINLDYEDISNLGEWVRETYGPDKMFWYPSINWAWEYHHFAALLASLDHVVTVCQSAAHLSAAMGLPTSVLVPSRPAWRYGLSSDRWFPYPHDRCKLYRQQDEDWGPAVEAMLKEIP